MSCKYLTSLPEEYKDSLYCVKLQSNSFSCEGCPNYKSDTELTYLVDCDDNNKSAFKTQEGGGHYKNMAIQPMEYIVKNKMSFPQGNVIKYVSRYKFKNGKEDLLKAIHNLEFMIELEYGEKDD